MVYSMARKSRPPAANPTRDLGLEAYDRLKEAIRDNTFPSGTRLTEADLSVWLGMSRTPAREALHRLEADGLVGHEPRRGLVVTRPDHQTIVELYVTREALEGTAAGLAAQHAGNAEIEAMGKLVAAEPDCADAAALSMLNQRLHRLIHVSAHNRFLLRSLSTLSDTMTLLPTMLGDPARAAQSHAEHRRVLAAIAQHDTAGAEEAMRFHLRSAQHHRVSVLVHGAESTTGDS